MLVVVGGGGMLSLLTGVGGALSDRGREIPAGGEERWGGGELEDSHEDLGSDELPQDRICLASNAAMPHWLKIRLDASSFRRLT